MRKLALPSVFAVVMAVAPMAHAATSATCAVKSYDAKTMMLTPEDGSQYQMSKAWKDSALKPGEKVAFASILKGKIHEARRLKVMK
ncbi:DUF1344 domain-containing protein [Pseudorhodobacter sp.]|uniref:DUF1344 domain-containing protein n=1 Tax=Pseudorhodobacter sp. TaxID=1934400 RepID=UPI002647C485|nr:DUF1344 domain-containing protein [Pseudorhodobacter sp.]